MNKALELHPDFDAWMLDQLHRCLTSRTDVVLQLSEVEEVLVSPAMERFITRATPAGVSRAPMRQQRLSATEQQELQARGRPLAELMWYSAFHASKGKLLDGCRRDDVVRLKSWPNFTRLPMTPNAIKIAALLSNRATSIVLASRILDIDEAEVFQFYSAARAAGYSQAVNRVETPQSKTAAPSNLRKQGLIRTLFNHLQAKSLRTRIA